MRVPGALFWFAPLQRIHTRSPSRKAGASAVLGDHRQCPLLTHSGRPNNTQSMSLSGVERTLGLIGVNVRFLPKADIRLF